MENILLSFPKSCEGSKIAVCGQLAPASLWKKEHLPGNNYRGSQVTEDGSTLLVGSLCSSTSFFKNLQEELFPNLSCLKDFCMPLGMSLGIPPILAAASPAMWLYLCVHHWRAPGLLQESTWSQERGRGQSR